MVENSCPHPQIFGKARRVFWHAMPGGNKHLVNDGEVGSRLFSFYDRWGGWVLLSTTHLTGMSCHVISCHVTGGSREKKIGRQILSAKDADLTFGALHHPQPAGSPFHLHLRQPLRRNSANARPKTTCRRSNNRNSAVPSPAGETNIHHPPYPHKSRT